MRDLESRLTQELKAAGSSFEPDDYSAARERFLQRAGRRRWQRALGGLALAGAALAAWLVFSSQDAVRRPEPIDVAGPAVSLRVEVGSDPVSVAPGAREVWTAVRGDGELAVVSPEGEVVDEVPVGEVNDVAVGADNAWAATETGVVRVDTATREVTGRFQRSHSFSELAVGGSRHGAVWAIDETGCIWEMTTGERLERCSYVLDPTDVTTDADEAWALDGDSGRLLLLNADPGVEAGRAPYGDERNIPTGPYADMVMFGEALWISGEGAELVRLDLVTGTRATVDLDGDYADLAAGPDAMWALAGTEGGDSGTLYRIDPASLSTDAVLVLGGKPSDLVATGDGVWVSLKDTGELLLVTPNLPG